VCSAPLPPRCTSCGASTSPGQDLCDNCRTEQIFDDKEQTADSPILGRDTADTLVTPIPSRFPQVVPSIRASFVGRMGELQKLKELFLTAREERQLHMVTVVGEPGAGKSRLALEFCRSVRAAIPDTRVLSGTAGGPGDPSYAPVIRVLEERFGIARSELPRDARAKIEAGVVESMPERLHTEVTHLLANMMGYPFDNSPVLEPLAQVPGQLEVRTFIAIRRFLEKDAEQGSLLIHFDSVERAGSETVNLIHYLAEGLRSAPVLLLVAARPTLFRRHPHWGEGEFPHERLVLEALNADESEALFHELMHSSDLPSELVRVVRNRLEGNPRAIEDLTRYLLEAGVVSPAGSRWTLDLAALGELSLPRAHEEILSARLRTLPAGERGVLEKAAAVGETFWLDAVLALERSATVAAGDPDGPTLGEIAEAGEKARSYIEDMLESLCEKGLVEERSQSTIGGEQEYTFAYPPLWDLAHELLDASARHRYHHLVAQWVELRPDGYNLERQEEAGRHLHRAGDSAAAAVRFHRAADAARDRYLNERSIRLYHRALSSVGESDIATRILLWHDLGNVYQHKGDLDSALDGFERMLRLSWVVASRTKAGVAFNKIGRVWRQKGNLDLALEYLERGRELFRQAGDLRGVATSLDDISQSFWLLGRYDKALDRSAKALEMRRKLGDRRSIATSLSNIGNIEKDRGLFDEAEACFRESMKLRKEVDDRIGFVMSLSNLGTLAFERGNLRQAREYWEDSLTEAEQVGAVPVQVSLLIRLSETALCLGKVSDARAGIDRAMTLASEVEDQRSYVEILRNLSLVELKEGNNDRARRFGKECLELAKKYRMRDVVGRAQMTLGEVHATTLFDESSSGKSQSLAEEHFRRAIKIFRDLGNEAELARALHRLGEFQVEKGNMGPGIGTLEEAVAIYMRLGIKQGEEVGRILDELR